LTFLFYNAIESALRENAMLIARVVGDVVSTIKDEKMNGRKLLIVREISVENELVGKPVVAVDTVDAGIGDVVLIAQGSSARQTSITKETPTDAVIMAIVDSLELEGKVTFRKG
jgi:microcompartment protein CcmK/EutM